MLNHLPCVEDGKRLKLKSIIDQNDLYDAIRGPYEARIKTSYDRVELGSRAYRKPERLTNGGGSL